MRYSDSSLIELQPRSNTEYISQSRTVLITDREGWITGDADQGLWICQSRALSRYLWTLNGKQPQLSAFSLVNPHKSLGYYICSPKNWRQLETKDPNPAQQSIELRVTRTVADGLDEEILITNQTQISTVVVLTLEVQSDFASPSDVQKGAKASTKIKQAWNRTKSGDWELSFDYRASHRYNHQGDRGVARIHRGIRLLLKSDVAPKYRNGKVTLKLRLPPHGSQRCWLQSTSQIDGDELRHHEDSSSLSARQEEQQAFLDTSAEFKSSNSPAFPALVLSTLQRSKKDLGSLRLFDLDAEDEEGSTWVPAGGLPSYVALFGRDSLTSGWQAALLSTAMMRGSLSELPKTQGNRVDDWRDEQPGRFVHELHTDPRATLNYNPHGRYYGGVTASIYYPLVVSALWHWTGNKQVVQQYIKPALEGLAWADRYLLDDSGFYRYCTRSKQGERNQGWKDSDDAIVHADGSQVKAPLGTCEMQAFIYASKMHFAEVLWCLDASAIARRLLREAEDLKKRFNDFFWMEKEGYFGIAIDAKKRLVPSIASDPGHCLASGIVDDVRAARVAERIMQPDLFSGWGVRNALRQSSGLQSIFLSSWLSLAG